MMRGVPRLAKWLGALGLVPMLACLAVAFFGEERWFGEVRLLAGTYAGIILSFLGGMWWGIAAGAPAAEGRGALGWVWFAAVSPSLIALAAAVWWYADPGRPEPPLVMLGFAVAASPLVDTRLAQMGLTPRWWMTLRWPLSLVLGAGALVLAYI